jgi:alpha-ketoglutarate-dependent taurine dioxygenase
MPEAHAITALESMPDALTVVWDDGRSARFPALWLRDCRPQDRDPHSGRRLIDVTDIPGAPRIRSAHAANGGLDLEFEGEPGASHFPADWLREHAAAAADRRPELRTRLWLNGSERDAKRDHAWLDYAQLTTAPSKRLHWLTHLAQDGIAFLAGVPARERAILEACAQMGRVAETNYGLLFEVRSVAQPENLAFSDHGLGLHTDNPYREPVPGFQALHVLVSSPDGGENLFADGFAIAEQLRATEPEAFSMLTGTPVPFYYRSAVADLYAERPLIQLSADGRIIAVHYNNRSIAPLSPTGVDLGAFYAAYRRLARLLREPRLQMRRHLGDGEMVVFDNQRTLHGRTAFSSQRHPRHLQGCYLTRDSVYSEIGLLRRGTGEDAR